jgi:hypothetical protein
MDGEVIAVVEFPQVRCPTVVHIRSDEGAISAEYIPRSSCLELEAVEFDLEVGSNDIGFA